MIFIAGVQENLYGSGDHEWYRKPWMVYRRHERYKKTWVQETIMIHKTLDGTGDDEGYRKPWMVQETMNGTGNHG